MTTPRVPGLDVYETAVLAGGLPRLVDTVLVALVESGRIRVHAPGELATASPLRRHPAEAAVLDAVGTRGHRSVDTIRWRLADDARLLDVGRRLRADGLLRRHPLSFLPPWRDVHVRTARGRRVLRELTARPPADRATDGGSAVTVALHGRDAMPDRRRCAEIFHRQQTALAPAGSRSRAVDHSDPQLAAYRTGGPASIAGGYALFEAGGFDGS